MDQQNRKVSTLFLLGIVLLPAIFSWFLLRRGYSQKARILGLGWMYVVIYITGSSTTQQVPLSNYAEIRTITNTPEPVKVDVQKDNDPDNTSSAIIELKKNSWIKDINVSSGHLNVGVIAKEKQFSSPMIAKFVCAILRNNQSKLKWIRFVDIEKVVYQHESPISAEIAKFDCRDFI